MKSPLLELQQKIFQWLTNNLSCDVYDEVPGNALMPYVVLGEDTAVDYATKLNKGSEITLTIHIWSDYNGYYEAMQIAQTIVDNYNDSLVQLTNMCVFGMVDMIEMMRDPEGYRHGIVRIRFQVLEVS